ncbi:bifunctional sugar phosphate isomerase/epimerase/4-hydroxyphenylpyruvate dioxygenase family protein [Pseudomonas sp. UBA1879]|uniref:bifunctional sugar phosphate isomerase/epimerase/4-hydroxyphenylpyruvate dioxygenase family protein n=1 Tax=Pseudomonas sp. UBA1879 TaxID=1947305 RepID=UPI0025DE6948|nr:sugar phosphate isomerase/epimerase and 4-hydroxyphenylpyruvate domain-containing protein [Pseudomonas sp. UBA1879]
MQRSIATVSLSGTLPEKLEAIAVAGFDGIELFENDLLCYHGSPRHVRQMCADLGLAITLFQPFRDFEGCRRDQLPGNLNRLARKFDLMQELGTDLMLVCSNTASDALGDAHILRDDLALLAERAGARQLRVAYEGLAWGRHVNTWQQAWHLVRQVDHPALGLVLDSFHTLSLQGDPGAIADLPGEKIFFVQMADAPLLAMDVEAWSRHFRCFPGQGEFDLPGFLAPILRSGYTGPLSLEIFNDVFRATPARPNAADALRSLLYLEEKTRARLAMDARPVAPELLFSPQAAGPYDGIACLEFAVDAAQSTRLGDWLNTLGFTRWGQHRAKAADLYGQGDIRIVLNAEPDAFAHRVGESHGPSLRAMALRVENGNAALARARQYTAQQHGAHAGLDDADTPAVRAPDGSLIYLVEPAAPGQSIYDRDFLLEPPAAAVGGLQRIDHVAMALPADSLDGGVLFYKSLLDFDAEDEVALPGPYGLVKSRAVRSRCSTVRLPLNVSRQGDTAVAPALSSDRGAGLHHIAFACDDIFARVGRAKALGLPMLQIPRNYYDDLAALFDFGDEFISQLAYHNVLYDRDADGGELFHAYTQPFEDCFFFEILQRKQGYAGYGAANVPVRLAAMAAARHDTPR